MPSGTSAEGLRATQERQVEDRRRRARATATSRPWLTARPFPATGAPTGSARRADHLAGDQSSTRSSTPTNRTSCSSLARARSSDGTGIRFCRSNSTLRHQRCPVAQVVARLGAPGILFMLPLGLELELLLRPQRQATVRARCQVPVLLKVGTHARRQDHPTLGIERAGEVPDELEAWRHSCLRSHYHGARPPRAPTSRHSMGRNPHSSTISVCSHLTEVASRRGRAASGSRRVGARRRSATSRSSTKARLGEGVGS